MIDNTIESYLNGKSLLYTEDCKLAACLVVLGCEPSQSQPTVPIVDHTTGRKRTRFHFENSEDAVKYIQIWHNKPDWEKFVAENPDHPLVYMRFVMTQRERYLDAALHSATLHVRKSEKLDGAFELTIVPKQ